MFVESKRAAEIRAELECAGFVVARVWWEPIQRAMEMCGPGGGWMAEVENYPGGIIPLGLNQIDALQSIGTIYRPYPAPTGDSSHG
jgi:hypothetical protein